MTPAQAYARRGIFAAGLVLYIGLAVMAVVKFNDWSLVSLFVGFVLGFVGGYRAREDDEAT